MSLSVPVSQVNPPRWPTFKPTCLPPGRAWQDTSLGCPSLLPRPPPPYFPGPRGAYRAGAVWPSCRCRHSRCSSRGGAFCTRSRLGRAPPDRLQEAESAGAARAGSFPRGSARGRKPHRPAGRGQCQGCPAAAPRRPAAGSLHCLERELRASRRASLGL